MAFNDTHRAALDLGIKDGELVSIEMADNIVIYKGDIVAYNAAGYADNSVPAAGMTFAGIAEETVDNTGTGHAAGATSIRVRTKGIVKLYKSSPVVDDQGLKCFPSYTVDAQTVVTAASDPANHSYEIGLCVGYDATAGTVDVLLKPGADITD